MSLPGALPVQQQAERVKLEQVLQQHGLSCQSEPEYLQSDHLENVIDVLKAAAQRDGWTWIPTDGSKTVWTVNSDPEMLVARNDRGIVVCLKLQPVSG